MIKKIFKKLKIWKPIHLCWWFSKHGWKIPKYLIGNPAISTISTFTDSNKSCSGLSIKLINSHSDICYPCVVSSSV